MKRHSEIKAELAIELTRLGHAGVYSGSEQAELLWDWFVEAGFTPPPEPEPRWSVEREGDTFVLLGSYPLLRARSTIARFVMFPGDESLARRIVDWLNQVEP